jgi:hypothetical protein
VTVTRRALGPRQVGVPSVLPRVDHDHFVARTAGRTQSHDVAASFLATMTTDSRVIGTGAPSPEQVRICRIIAHGFNYARALRRA